MVFVGVFLHLKCLLNISAVITCQLRIICIYKEGRNFCVGNIFKRFCHLLNHSQVSAYSFSFGPIFSQLRISSRDMIFLSILKCLRILQFWSQFISLKVILSRAHKCYQFYPQKWVQIYRNGYSADGHFAECL